MPDSLAVIRAQVAEQTNVTTVLKGYHDEDNAYRQALQSTATTVNQEVKGTNDSLTTSDGGVDKVWSTVRKRIQVGALTIMGNLAGLSYPLGVGLISGNMDGDLLEEWSKVPNSKKSSGSGGGIFGASADPYIDKIRGRWYNDHYRSFDRAESSLAESMKVAQDSPYVTLMNAAISLVEVNKYVGIAAIAAVYGLTLLAMDQEARNDSDNYIAQSSVGRASLRYLQGYIRRGINPNKNDLTYKDKDIFRAPTDDQTYSYLWNSQVTTQYDGDPLASNPSQLSARYIQDGI